MRNFLRVALLGAIVNNALRVAVVVGTVLNLINQGDAIWSGTGISWGHIALNYLVPYCVATYSATCQELRRQQS